MSLHTNNQQLEKDVKKIILFIVTLKKNHLGINLTKKMWDSYEKNYKIFICVIPKLKSNLNQWFPPQFILSVDPQPKFSTVDSKRGKNSWNSVYLSSQRHSLSLKWLSGFAVDENPLGKCVKHIDPWIRPYS